MAHHKQGYSIIMTVVMGLLVGIFFVVSAQEHPQQEAQGSGTKQTVQQSQGKQEHPTEHPNAATKKITKETLAQAIADYVNREAKLKGGYFLFYDAKEGKTLALKLDKVHKDRLAKLGDDEYFACSDFKATDGNMYDLDIFMKGKSPDHLEVTQITLHKKNGKPRYTWYEENGVWKRKPVR